jgi:hypothetical protein
MIPAVFCIKSVKKEIPFDFWKHAKFNDLDKTQISHISHIHLNKLDNTLVDEIYQKESILSSNCFLVRYRSEIFVITCRHSIHECYKYEIIIEKKPYELNKIIDIPEFDTTVLKIINISKDLELEKYDIIDINTLDCKVDDIKKILICSHNKSININFLKIIENDVGNESFAVIPQICLEIKKKSNNFGLSGSPCFDSKKGFIGHVFTYDDCNTSINIIPAYCLKYIFTELLSKSIIKLKTINIEGTNSSNVSLCSIYDDDTKLNLNAYKIKKTNHIEYKLYGLEKTFHLKENMLITKIDNLPINKEGKVLFDTLNTYLMPQTYILLNNNLDYIKIDGYELIDGNYSAFSVNIIPEVLLNHMLFSEFDNNIIIYKNLVFTELSREILNLCDINKNKKLMEILDNPYSKKFNKQIILIDILDNISLPDDKLKVLKNNLQKHSFIFLNKFNKKNITNLEDLYSNMSNTSENNFSFDMTNKKYKNLLY